MGFIAHHYRLTPAELAAVTAPHDIVVRREQLAIAADADSLIAAARRREEEILQEAQTRREEILAAARQEADNIIAQAKADAEEQSRAVVEQAEDNVWKDARDLFEQVRATHEHLMHCIEPLLSELLGEALEFAFASTPDKERIASSIRHVIAHSRNEAGATLFVHPSDKAVLETDSEASPWPVEEDPSLTPGACRLTSPRGEWRASFRSLQRKLQEWAGRPVDNAVQEE